MKEQTTWQNISTSKRIGGHFVYLKVLVHVFGFCICSMTTKSLFEVISLLVAKELFEMYFGPLFKSQKGIILSKIIRVMVLMLILPYFDVLESNCVYM